MLNPGTMWLPPPLRLKLAVGSMWKSPADRLQLSRSPSVALAHSGKSFERDPVMEWLWLYGARDAKARILRVTRGV